MTITTTTEPIARFQGSRRTATPNRRPKRSQISTVTLGGSFATVVTLLVVPAAYRILDDPTQRRNQLNISGVDESPH